MDTKLMSAESLSFCLFSYGKGFEFLIVKPPATLQHTYGYKLDTNWILAGISTDICWYLLVSTDVCLCIPQELVMAKHGAVEMPSFHVWGLEDPFRPLERMIPTYCQVE